MHISIRDSFIKLKIHNGAVKGKVHSNIACQWRLEGCLESSFSFNVIFRRSCFYVKIACHNIAKVNSAERSFAALLPETLILCELEKRAPWSVFLPSSLHHWTLWRALCRWTHAVQPPPENATGHIWRGTLYRLYWKLKEQRLLKSASGTMTQSWRLVIHEAFAARALPLSLHIFLCLPLLFFFKSYSSTHFKTIFIKTFFE